ncbi:hypothetical protein QNO09_31080 [Streptomyces sp. 378]|uniref:hypothetical protein n=1 Tax=Streptomyces sp. 378 TaxID=3049412 RepID=UPI0024C2E62B|nr:hypothetical protein [Streptomyces sp. 378]MDK1347659.1 hypothetical protein [Streptomyces sp. 378]
MTRPERSATDFALPSASRRRPVFNESGNLVHYRYALLLAIPQPDQTGVWNDGYLIFGSSWVDVRLKVTMHDHE